MFKWASYSPLCSKHINNHFHQIYMTGNLIQKTSQINRIELHVFLIRNTFIRNAMMKLAKKQAKARQHSQAEFLLFENY